MILKAMFWQLMDRDNRIRIPHPLPKDTRCLCSGFFFWAEDEIGFERAAPVCTLVQKLRAGEQFLARGRIHDLVNAPGWV